MNIDHPIPSQIPQLRHLWKEAFGDSDEALDAFFTTAYASERCMCITDGSALAAAAYWFHCRQYAYIYAVATAKSHRGQGLCHQLMDAIHALLAEEGYAGAIVVPGEESLRSFYKGMGYGDFGGIRIFTCAAGEEPLPIWQVDATEFAALRREFLPAGAVVQENENLAYLQTYTQFYAGSDFLLTAMRADEQLQGFELLGNVDAAPGILTALGAQSGTFRTIGTRPFAMYYPLGEKNPPTYLGFAFD